MTNLKETYRGGKVVDANNKHLDTAKGGGNLKGRLHKECNDEGDCGIKLSNNGEPLEAQGGEVIITAPAVKSKQLHKFEGKEMTNKEILSAINQSGGGVAFEKGGAIEKILKKGGKLPNIGNSISDLTDKEKGLLSSMSFGKLRYAIINNPKRIKGIIDKGLGYLTKGKKGKELHLTPKGVAYVRALPKKIFNIHSFAKGGVVMDDDTAEIDPKDCKYFKGFYFEYQNQFVLSLAIYEYLDKKESLDDNDFDEEEKKFIGYFKGFGGLSGEQKQFLGNNDHFLTELDEFFTHGFLQSPLTEFYTPQPIVQAMWRLAYKYGFKDGMTVYEPSCGIGEFFKPMKFKQNASGNEINYYSYKIASILYPQITFTNESFEKQFTFKNESIKGNIDGLKKYDLVIGNPPYGKFNSLYAGIGERAYSGAQGWIEYFIFRGLDLVKPYGLLIYVIGTSNATGGKLFLEGGESEIKKKISEKANLIDAYILPNGLFETTDIVSEIVVFKKI